MLGVQEREREDHHSDTRHTKGSLDSLVQYDKSHFVCLRQFIKMTWIPIPLSVNYTALSNTDKRPKGKPVSKGDTRRTEIIVPMG